MASRLIEGLDDKVAQKIVLKYRELDTNRDGMLNYEELAGLLKKGNPDFSEAELRSLFESIGDGLDDKIDLSEFVAFLFSQQPAETKTERLRRQMTVIAEQQPPLQVEIMGASINPDLNGVYEGGPELINGRPVYDRVSPVLTIFYGWTQGRKREGWFIARRAPEKGPVKRYLMFNPSPFAQCPERCCATWEAPTRARDKRMVLLAVEQEEWDQDCREGTCLPDELFGDAEQEAEEEVEELHEENADAWDQAEAAEGEEADWEHEWIEEAGEFDKPDEAEDEEEVEDEATGHVDMFVDPVFPPEAASLGGKGAASADGWTRLSEMHKDACLFKRIVPEDIVRQDNVANAWFLSACAAVAEYPAWIQSMFGKSTTLSPDGKYTVRLYHPGKKAFMNVTVDDFVPTRGNSPAYVGIGVMGELWIALLEKAFAKLNGSYKAMGWGTVAYGLLYLCGGGGAEGWTRCSRGTWKRSYTQWRGKADDTISRRRAEGAAVDAVEIGQAMLWLLLRQNMELCYPVACTADKSTVVESNLRHKFSYSLLAAREVNLDGGKTLRMVQLRNGFGQTFFRGRWSDNSQAWGECPAAKQQLRFTPKGDGTFWMCYSDFLRYFDHIDCVRKSMPVQGTRQCKLVGARRGLQKFGMPDY